MFIICAEKEKLALANTDINKLRFCYTFEESERKEFFSYEEARAIRNKIYKADLFPFIFLEIVNIKNLSL